MLRFTPGCRRENRVAELASYGWPFHAAVIAKRKIRAVARLVAQPAEGLAPNWMHNGA